MLKNTFRLTLFVAVTISAALSMDAERNYFTSLPGHFSAETMPKEYQAQVEVLKPLPRLDLDQICPHADVPTERLSAWKPVNLHSGGFMTVMGLYFLNFDDKGFERQFPGHVRVEPESNDPKSFYFGGLWNSLWLSASLVSKTKYPTAGSYGIVLEIPPELIIKTYQLDSTTMTHGALFEKSSSGEDINTFAKEYLSWGGGYNAEMITEFDASGQAILGSRRIFAPGESENSPHFMTPDEMIERGRPFEHNEVKFVPQGVYQGKEHKIKIAGLWYKDKLHGSLMQSPVLDSETKSRLEAVAKEIGVLLIPLSQTTSE